ANPVPAVEETLPDPFAQRPTPLFSVAIAAFLVIIAAGALWLGRRRPMEPEGPAVVTLQEPRGRRAAPEFYEDLRQRETALEDLEDRSPGRSRPRVVELPVDDHPSAEGDR
ncbi:MAG: hypothetical protein WBO71_06985, partial [Thermoanaerobaculia bacterium]